MAAMPARAVEAACGWCGQQQRWPLSCPGDPADEFCLEEIVWRHELGDHRRCSPHDCDAFALVSEVASRGQAHALASGKPLVVVNTLTEPWSLRGFDRLQQAKPYRIAVGRHTLGKDAPSIAVKTRVFVVRADGSVI